MPRVLVVEDEPSLQALVGALLTDEGYEYCVVDSLAALDAHRADEAPHPHDLVMADMKLADGSVSIRYVTELADRERASLLVVSGSRESADAAAAEGVAFVAKPYEIDDLVRVIRRLVPVE